MFQGAMQLRIFMILPRSDVATRRVLATHEPIPFDPLGQKGDQVDL